MGLLLFALYAASHYGTSAPILRSRQEQISSWHSEPNGRGTWSLLNSCVITMAICVWSAVHLNVPGHPPKGREGKSERWKVWNHQCSRTRWALMGLLAPELVVYCAWVQWSNARELSRRIARAEYPRKHQWTLAHSFFAGMGGFAVDSGDFISGQDYLYLTTAGVQRIVELGHQLPDLRKEAIFDKSKADSLGKILLCLQAGYMVFQVIGRLVARLPITLLEVNTLGHVLCALTMYAFWFHKPLCVSDPVVLSEYWAKPSLCLWFMMSDQERKMRDLSTLSKLTLWYRELDLLRRFVWDCREHEKKRFSGTPSGPGSAPQACPEPKLSPQIHETNDWAASGDAREIADVKDGLNTAARAHAIIQQDLPEDLEGLANQRILFYKQPEPSQVFSDEDIIHRLRNSKLWDNLTHVFNCDKQDQIEAWWKRWSEQVVLVPEKTVSPFQKDGVSAFIPQHIFLDSIGLRRWELAHRGLDIDPDVPVFVPQDFESGSNIAFVIRRVENWPRSKTLLIPDPDAPFWTMFIVTALYGALHALCWHSHFPSVAEKMLWRTSSIVIAAGPVTVFAVGCGILLVGDWLGDGILFEIWFYMCFAAFLLCGLVYVSARLFILIEAFISIRSLPEGAYQTPNWTAWLPHL